MIEWVWTFERADEHVGVARWDTGEACVLMLIHASDPPRLCRFADLPTLLQFQMDMETFLLRTGWSLVTFSPERRRGHERRTFPRIEERRRWWTDARVLTPA